MAAITKELTWATESFTGSGSTLAEQCAEVLHWLKNRMLAAGFSIDSTCDSTTATVTDLWALPEDVVWNSTGNAHSWAVLTHDTDGYQICFDCVALTNDPSRLTLVLSPGGDFSGGSTTTRPTASDEIIVLDGASWAASNAGVRRAIFSSDSTNRFFFFNARYTYSGNEGTPTGAMIFGKPLDYDTTWTTPYVLLANSTGFSQAVLMGGTANFFYSDGAPSAAYVGSLYVFNNSVALHNWGSYYNDLCACPVYILGTDNTILGRVPDFYQIEASFATLNDYISDGASTRAWVVAENYAIPSDGDTLSLDTGATPTDFDNAQDMSIGGIGYGDLPLEIDVQPMPVEVELELMLQGLSDVRQGGIFNIVTNGSNGILKV